MYKMLTLLSGLIIASSVHAASSNLITNGSFEQYSVDNNAYMHIAGDCSNFKGVAGFNSTCSTNGLGWDSYGHENEYFEVRNNLIGVAQHGNQFAELNPSAQSGVEQLFEASAGMGSLSWFDRGRNQHNYAYEILLNGRSIFNAYTENTSDWTMRSFTGLSLLDGMNSLVFNSLSTGDIGANIDNVVMTQSTINVSAVPEADTIVLLMFGFAIFGFMSRRRKCQ